MKIVGGILGPEKPGGYEVTCFPAIGPNFLDAHRRATPIGIIAQTVAQRSVPDGFLIFWYPDAMKITVELPEDLAQHADPGREALEALAIVRIPVERAVTLSSKPVAGVIPFLI